MTMADHTSGPTDAELLREIRDWAGVPPIRPADEPVLTVVEGGESEGQSHNPEVGGDPLGHA